MADVSQLEINGTTYDICDATVRNSLSQYLPLSGGTLTGSIRTQSIDIDRNGADPSAYVTGISIAFSDKDGDNIGLIRPGRNASGREDLQISVRNENNDTQVENNLTLQVAKDGTCSYYVSDGLAFCNAIGALPLSGGTMSSAINMGSNNIENVDRIYAHYHQLTESGQYRGNIYISGDYLYIQGYDTSGISTCQYRFNLTDWGITYREYANNAWGSWTTWMYSSQASRTANTVLAAPNGSAGKATFRALVPDDVPWIGDRTTIVSSGTDKPIPTGTWTDLGTFTVTAGRKYLATFHTEWNAHADGAVSHAANTSVAAPNNDTTSSYVTSGAANNIERLTSMSLYQPTATTTYHFCCYQGTGSNLTLRGHSAFLMRIA